VNEDYADVGGAKIVEAFCSRPEEVVDFRRHLNTRESSAGNDTGEQLFAAFGICFDFGFVEYVDEVISEPHGIGEILEREGVLLQSGDAAEIRDSPESDDKMVPFEQQGLGAESGGEDDFAVFQIDRFDIADVDACAWDELLQGADSVEQADVSGHDFSKHGLEDEVILAVDQSDFDFGLASKEAFKSHCGVNASETSTEDQDPFGLGHGSFPLTMTVNQG
jgi:hypothetical protein